MCVCWGVMVLWGHVWVSCEQVWLWLRTSRFSSIATPLKLCGQVLSVVGSPGGPGPWMLWWGGVQGLTCGASHPDERCLGSPASRWWWCSAPLGGPLLFYLGMGVWLSRDWMALMAFVPGRGHWVLCPVLRVAPCLRLQCPSLTNQYTKRQTYTHYTDTSIISRHKKLYRQIFAAGSLGG